MKKIKNWITALFSSLLRREKKIVGNEAVFHPTTDKEVMKFKMQKAQIHSSANESASPDSTLIALALIYLET